MTQLFRRDWRDDDSTLEDIAFGLLHPSNNEPGYSRDLEDRIDGLRTVVKAILAALPEETRAKVAQDLGWEPVEEVAD